jgi:uracil-DNA glycosylase
VFHRKLLHRLWAEVASGRSRVRVTRRLPVPAVGTSAEDGPESLARIGEQVAICHRCPLGNGRTRAVPGEGDPHPSLVFVGEAPGQEEDLQGRPFVGPAGQLLTRMIAAMSLSREQVYITNIVKCRPPRNREPLPEEVAACRDYLRRQLALLRPRIVVALGGHAARWLLGAQEGITRIRGQVFDLGDFRVVPTFHPSYLLRSPEEKRKAWADLQVVMGLLGLAPSGA